MHQLTYLSRRSNDVSADISTKISVEWQSSFRPIHCSSVGRYVDCAVHKLHKIWHVLYSTPVYLAFLSLGLISGLKEIFHQEGVIGFFRGKFKSYFVLPYTVKPLLMDTAHSWTPPLCGHLWFQWGTNSSFRLHDTPNRQSSIYIHTGSEITTILEILWRYSFCGLMPIWSVCVCVCVCVV